MTEPTTGTPRTAPTATDSAPERPHPRPGVRAGLLLALLTVAWLAARLWATYRQLRDGDGTDVALASGALALPAIVQTAMLAGLGCGYAARTALHAGDRHPDAGLFSRWLVAPVAGLLIGALALAATITAYGDVTSTLPIGLTAIAAGLLGGVFAAVPRPAAIAAAGVVAGFGAFLLETILNSGGVANNMMAAFGGKPSATPADVVNASGIVAHIDSAVIGLAAGLLAFWYLHRQGGLRFPAYQLAGAATGLVLLASEALVMTGGSGLLHAVAGLGSFDHTMIDVLNSGRLINGLLVLFIGAVVAVVAFGRTLGPRPAQPSN